MGSTPTKRTSLCPVGVTAAALRLERSVFGRVGSSPSPGTNVVEPEESKGEVVNLLQVGSSPTDHPSCLTSSTVELLSCKQMVWVRFPREAP